MGEIMTVPVIEFEGLDVACGRGHRIVESGRSELCEHPVAVLFPPRSRALKRC